MMKYIDIFDERGPTERPELNVLSELLEWTWATELTERTELIELTELAEFMELTEVIQGKKNTEYSRQQGAWVDRNVKINITCLQS